MACSCGISAVGGREKNGGDVLGGVHDLVSEKKPEEPSFSNLAGQAMKHETDIRKMEAKSKLDFNNMISLSHSRLP